MIRIANAQLWVRDQDEALAFYTQKVGWVVRSDLTFAEFGAFRWVSVGPADQPDIGVVLLAIPGPPVMDEQTAQQLRDLVSKGFAGTILLTTDDCRVELVQAMPRRLPVRPGRVRK